MKKSIILLMKLAFVMSAVVMFVVVIYMGYIFSDLNQDVDRKKVEQIIAKVKSSQKHDDQLIAMYNRMHKNTLEKSSWNNVWNWFWGDYYRCPCLDVARMSYINKRHKIEENNLVISVAMERDVSQIDCLNYIFENSNYFFGIIGVNEAARCYFGKPANELMSEELIGLIILQQQPVLYNPIRNREKYDKKVAEVKMEIGM